MSATFTFGRWLSAQRHLLGLTQSELARQVGCSVITIRKLEAGERRPSKQIAERLAAGLQILPEQRAAFLQSARGQTTAIPTPYYRGTSASLHTSVVPASPPTQNNLPTQLTSFLGRQRELSVLADLLTRPDCRLISLVGPGGVGKTRLALQAAAQVSSFAHGVTFVPLASVATPDLLVASVARALGLDFHNQEDQRVQLAQYVHAKELLLVLDNLEHLLAGVELFADLLRDAPHIKILATSRERLNLYGEWIFGVEGLTFPADTPAASIGEYDSVRLFLATVDRARSAVAIGPDELPDVARICRMTEGLPLAVELAAGWTRTLSVQDIVAEMQHGIDVLTSTLRDVPERHRSVRAVFDHSWRMLSESDQLLLRRLSVFHGAFQLEEASQIAGATPANLAALIDKSLLRASGAGKYELHELVRQYAAEQLAAVADDHAATHAAHCHYYSLMVAECAARLTERDQQAALTMIDGAIENVRAGWAWGIARGRVAEILPYVDGLWLYHDHRALFRQGAALFKDGVAALGGLVERTENKGHVDILSRLMLRQAWFCHWLGELQQAHELLARRETLVRGGDALRERALALLIWAEVVNALGERAKAGHCYRESLALFQVAGDHFGAAYALIGQSALLRIAGAFDDASQLAQAALALSEAAGDQYMLARVLEELSHIARDHADPHAAKRYCLRSLEIARTLGNRWGVMSALLVLATNGWVYGEYEEAKHWCVEGLAIARDIGRLHDVHEFLRTQAILAGLQREYHVAAQLCQESMVLAQQIGQRQLLAQTVILQSWIFYGQGQYVEARHHAYEALGLFESRVGLILAHLGVGRAACALGAVQEARASLGDALRIAQTIGGLQYVPYVLSTCAALLWKVGARQRAVEILTLIIHHPESSRMARDEATLFLNSVEGELPPHVLAMSRERGQAQTFETLVEDFLAQDAP